MTQSIKLIAENLLNEWIDTLKTQDPQQMVALYSESAMLLPTLDSIIRNNSEKIKEYFVSFLAKEPQCKIQHKQIVVLGDDAVSIMGHYGFKFKGGASANARFTYIFVKNEGEWKIEHHHSSLQPQ